ncbi:hypothetical protein HK405_003086, partial [Cladochytrium tenue]
MRRAQPSTLRPTLPTPDATTVGEVTVLTGLNGRPAFAGAPAAASSPQLFPPLPEQQPKIDLGRR